MKIAVLDGQGGGVGKAIVEKLRQLFSNNVFIVALGTNAMATSLMMRSGADEGATGENAVVYNVSKVDIVIGPIGIICANSMLGELTPLMAKSVAESPAKKILIPLSKCSINVAGVEPKMLSGYIDDVAVIIKTLLSA